MKTSIQKKIIQAFLVVCLTSLLVSGLISVVQMRQIRDITEENNRRMGSVVADSSSESLIRLALEKMQALTDEKGQNINAQFQTYANALAVMGRFVGFACTRSCQNSNPNDIQ